MVVHELSVSDFRNYHQQHIELARGLNVIVGRNGQGKTNLMEAIYLILQLHSFRPHRWEQLVRNGASMALMQGILESKLGSDTVKLEISVAGRKAWWNKQVVKKMSAHVRRSFAVFFNPELLYQHRYQPGERRALLDGCLSFTDANYAQHLVAYSQARRQKNQLLKEQKQQSMEAWNSLLITHGRELVAKRHQLVEQLNPIIAELSATIAEVLPPTSLKLRYLPQLDGDQLYWQERFNQVAEQERRIGHVLIGPHRDNLQMWREQTSPVNPDGTAVRTAVRTADSQPQLENQLDNQVESQFSQGEYRLALLTLKLALSQLLQDDAVLILDDFFSELDSSIRQKLCSHLNQIPNQVFITTTEASNLTDLKEVNWMQVENGAVTSSLH